MRVLVLHQHYWPEIAATAQILSDLCEDLADAGHRVTVVCGHPSYRMLADSPRSPAREQRRAVEIQRVWSYAPPERTIPKRLAHYGTYFMSSLWAQLTAARPDVCLVMSTPPLLLGISGTLGRALRGVPFVYSVQDLYPDIAVHLGVLRKGGAITRMSEVVARTCYRAAHAVVTLSHGMAQNLAKKGVRHDRIHVIPNWSDTGSVVPAPRDNAFAREHGLAERFVVQYSGNLGLSQGLECVIEAAERLRTLPVTFAVVGDGNARAGLQRVASERGLDNVLFLPPQPRERLAELLAACDVGLVTMKRVVGDDLVPSKLYGIMAAQRPVLAAVGASSEVARVVREHDCGWIVPPESPDELARAIRAIFETPPAERLRRALQGRLACEQQYSRMALTRRYEQVLRASCQSLGAQARR